MLSGVGVPHPAIVTSIALRLSQLVESRKLKYRAAFIAAVLAVSSGSIISTSAVGEPVTYASGRYASVAAIMARAQRGDPAAAARLGWLFSTGRGVPQNYYEAAKWYYRAATRGNSDAQFALGVLYNKGQGVPVDYVLSYMWLNLSAAHVVGSDHEFRAAMRDAIASKMTPRQLLTAQDLALKWVKSR